MQISGDASRMSTESRNGRSPKVYQKKCEQERIDRENVQLAKKLLEKY